MILFINACVREESRTEVLAKALLSKLGDFEEVKLEVPEEKEEFDITASFAELAEYSETAREIQKRAEEEIYRRYSDRSPEDAEVRMIIETFKDGTADSTALLGSDIDYGLVLKCIEEANQALAAAQLFDIAVLHAPNAVTVQLLSGTGCRTWVDRTHLPTLGALRARSI